MTLFIAQGKFVTSTPLPKSTCIGNADQTYLPKSSKDKIESSVYKKPLAKVRKSNNEKTPRKYNKDKEVT